METLIPERVDVNVAMGAMYGMVCPDMMVEGERRDIFRSNEYLRNTQGVRKTDVLRYQLSVPNWDRVLFGRINPALNSRDAVERSNAWKAFLRHPASLPYRVME